jgi:hypothetical protein
MNMSVTHTVVTAPADFTTTPYTPRTEELRTEYVGATLKVSFESVQIMSDVWETAQFALVWDAENQKPKKITWITKADVDATPEVKEAFSAYHADIEFKKRIARLEADALVPVRGDQVKIVRGRKNFGLVGEVTAITTFPDRYSYGRYDITKVAVPIDDTYEEIALRNGKGTWKKYTNVVWVNIDYAERVVPRTIDYVGVAQDVQDWVKYEFKDILKGGA